MQNRPTQAPTIIEEWWRDFQKSCFFWKWNEL